MSITGQESSGTTVEHAETVTGPEASEAQVSTTEAASAEATVPADTVDDSSDALGRSAEIKPEVLVAAYVPPPSVMKKLVRRSVGLTGEETVSMPAQVYNKLIEVALAAVFDEEAYLERFPDIKAAVEAGKLQSGLQHFLAFGYAEGRPPRRYAVDENWYLSTYRDVAKAVGGGHVNSAGQHFEAFGFAEGRAPNRTFEKTVADWRRLEQQASKPR